MTDSSALAAEAAVLAVIENGDFTKLAGIPFKDAMAAWDRLHAATQKDPER